MKKKKLIIVAIIILFLVFLTPIPSQCDDGGTIEYHAIVYNVTNYHSIKIGGYYTGIVVKVFGITVYDNTTFGQ